MKVILQRVLSASVTVDKKIVSSIGKGMLVLAAVAPGDTEKECESMAAKLLKIRLWDDDSGGRWKRSVKDINAEVLCVSQFTLLASTKKGSKPDFHGAMGGEEAKRLYHHFLQKVKDGYEADKIKDGVFQAMMEVSLVNDGPVTLEFNVEPPMLKTPKGTSNAAEEVAWRGATACAITCAIACAVACVIACPLKNATFKRNIPLSWLSGVLRG